MVNITYTNNNKKRMEKMTEDERYGLIKGYTSIFKHRRGTVGIIDHNTKEEMGFEEVVERLNQLNNENKQFDITMDKECIEKLVELLNCLYDENEELKKQLSDLQKENYGNIDGIAFYQEENATLCEKISDLEYENEELKEKLNEDDKMRWSKKTEKTVQDCDGEEYNIQEIVNALNHYQRTVDELRRENHELYNRVNELRRENYELYNRVNENTNNIK